MYTEEIKEKARQLRKEGMSIAQISSNLKIGVRSSVYQWVKDVPLDVVQSLTIKNRTKDFSKKSTLYRLKRKKFQEKGISKINDKDYLAGCMLYWCEGTKSKNSLRFCNSDASMMKVFIGFIKKYFSIRNEEIKWRLNCRLDNGTSIEEIECYWQEQLGLDPLSKRKHTFKEKYYPDYNPEKKIVYGVCSISVERTDIVQEIYGAIQAYGNFENKNWLK